VCNVKAVYHQPFEVLASNSRINPWVVEVITVKNYQALFLCPYVRASPLALILGSMHQGHCRGEGAIGCAKYREWTIISILNSEGCGHFASWITSLKATLYSMQPFQG
jgi:hypothetical protein